MTEPPRLPYVNEPTERELEVLATWKRCGGDEAEVARRLGLSRFTVHGHLANVRAKCGVRKTWQAAEKLLAA